MTKKPNPHRAGITPPKLAKESIPNHVAIVMDGNGCCAGQDTGRL